MKLSLIYVSVIVMVSLFSCSTKPQQSKNIKEKISIKSRSPLPLNKKNIVFEQLRPKSQHFTIKVNSNNSITGANGTAIFIPKNSFIDANGNSVAGDVDIEIIEVLSLADMVKANLQTVSNNKLLESNGMIYIDAKSNGQPLGLAADKKIHIELPKMSANPTAGSNMQIFSGSFDRLGNTNWQLNDSIKKKLIPFPLDVFDYSRQTSFPYIRIANNDGYSVDMSTYLMTSTTDSTTFKQPQLKNSFIATREFEERFEHINAIDWAVGTHNSYNLTTTPTGTIVKDSAVAKIYLNNLDKELWYCDSLAYDYIKNWKQTGNKQLDFNNYIYTEGPPIDYLAVFKGFYLQRLTTTIKFPADVDFTKENAGQQLAAKGLSTAEIDELLAAYETQSNITTYRRNKTASTEISKTAFSVAALGWANCDRFSITDKPTSISINILNIENTEFVNVLVIVNNLRIGVNVEKDKNNRYNLQNLPLGEKCTIIAISYKSGRPYLAIKETVISADSQHELTLKESSVAEINQQISKIE